MLKTKIIDKKDILEEKDAKYIWSIFIRKKE